MLHWYVGDCTVSINFNAIAAIDHDFLRNQALKNSMLSLKYNSKFLSHDKSQE